MKNHIKLVVVPFLLLLFTINSFAKERSIKDLENVALNFSKMNSPLYGRQKTAVKIKSTVKTDKNTMYRIINLKPEGWVIVSRDDIAKPVLAYSSTGSIDNLEKASPSFKNWMKGMNTEIIKAKQDHLDNDEYIDEWENLTLESNVFEEHQEASVASARKGPLLGNINWNQNAPYNAMTPKDSRSYSSYKGRVPVGCVATAMAQIMAYHKWPNRGKGSHTDKKSNYGNLYANFNTTYKWNNMSNYDLAKISYHLGISTDMMYAPKGSGTYSRMAAVAWHKYFRYATDKIRYRSSSTNMHAWHAKIKQNIDRRLPIYYAGGYHAFVIDGYNYTSTKYYHFNFGWGGYQNGWYTIDATNSPFNFKHNQKMISGIKPTNKNINPPSNFKASKISSNSVTLTWKDRSIGEGGYAIILHTSHGNILIAKIPANSTTFTVKNLAANTSYTFQVYPLSNKNGNFARRNVVSISVRTKKINISSWYVPVDYNLVY